MTPSLRALTIGLLAVGLVLSLVGTGGFSAATADREVKVATTTDERAYVGYDSPDTITIETDGNAANESGINGSETVTLVTLTNRFSVDIDVTEVEIDEKPDDLNVTVRLPLSEVSSGESEAETIAAELECQDSFEAESLSVTVHLEGNGIEVVVFGNTESRSISVTCRTAS